MKTIYRIEDDSLKGPYNSLWPNGTTMTKWEFLGIIPYHPSPEEEGFTGSMHGYKCGFISMKQLQKWFSKSLLMKLFYNGFEIKTYIVPDENVVELKHQCIFKFC